MALTSRVAWVGLERILRRMRQFFRSALARSHGARSWAMEGLTAFMPADTRSGDEPAGGPVEADLAVRGPDRRADAVVGAVRLHGHVGRAQGGRQGVLGGGAGVMARAGQDR